MLGYRHMSSYSHCVPIGEDTGYSPLEGHYRTLGSFSSAYNVLNEHHVKE